jgi:serine/threonine-protein kinase
MVLGTPAYMSPEQMMASSDVDARSDVWSMGAVLYELVTGHHPFLGDRDLQIFANVMTKPPVPIRAHVPGEVPPAAEAILLKCLRRPREDRFESMTALAHALRATVA